jgi:hypothetical protein
MKIVVDLMTSEITNEALVNDGTDLFHGGPLLLLYLFHVPPPIWTETPFTTTSFLSLSLLFELHRFQWQCYLECPDLLH